MHPHTPQDRRAFESPDWTAPEPHDERTPPADRTRQMQVAMLVAFLLLVAVTALVVLL